MGERGGVIDYVQGETGPSGPPPSLPVKLVRVFGSFVLISVFMPLSTEQQKQSLTEHLTLRRLMSYIYGAPILDVSRSHTTTQHSR